MLIGRARELHRLDTLVTALESGRGGALFVSGEAGVGKTALLEELRARADARGIRTLLVRGVESETELAFSALHDVLAPLVAHLDTLPAPQAAALASALALAPPQPGDRLAVCVATLGLLQCAATDRPLLVIVDDLPWVDAASRECLLFAARRIGGSASVVVSARLGDMPVAPSGLDELRVDPLTHDDAVRLLADAAPDLVPSVAAAIAEAAAGNPLAVIELAATLEPEQRSGLASLPSPLSPGPRLGDAYRRRIATLSDAQRRALLVAAAYRGEDMHVISAACRAAGVDAAHLEAAERAGLVRVANGRLSFVHPLARGAVYHECAPEERRAVHAALAGVLTGEQRAWHLGAATVAPDEQVAAELEAAGNAALARRGPAPASLALERAARLSPDRADFTRRMLAAGQAAAAAALGDRALSLLKEAAEAATDPSMRASAHHLYALTLLRTSAVPAAEILGREGARVASQNPTLAAMMLSDAAMAYGAAARLRPALQLTHRAVAVLGDCDDPVVRAHVLACHGIVLQYCGEGRRARPILDEAARLAEDIDPLSPVGQSITLTLNVHLWSCNFEYVRDRCLAACTRARETGTLSALPLLLLIAADASYRMGDWDAAEQAVAECVAASDDCGQPAYVDHARAVGALLAAARGDEEHVRRTVPDLIAGAEATGVRGNVAFALGVMGFLDLGLGRIGEAIAQLEELARFSDRSGMQEPTLIPWETDLIEAYLRAGRDDDAQRLVAVLGRRAAAVDTPLALALHARCLGMVADDFEGHFRTALRHDDARPVPFERARTLLAYGRRLHRAGRRADARAVLHDAIAGFERLRATPWLNQARHELRAAGGRRRTVAERDRLTRHERRVAAVVARGLTNREAAAELFLSPKTIEFHLGQIYRKLGIRSRAQLPAALDEYLAGETSSS